MKKETSVVSYRETKDSGVSPVVGVMLMLVVTIVVAAIIASFAGGLTSTSEKAPTSTLDVSLYRGNMKSAVIENIAGDALETRDLLITVSYNIPVNYGGTALAHGGEDIIHIIDGGLAPSAENNLDTTLAGYPYVIQTTNNDDVVSKRIKGQERFGEVALVSGSKIVFDLNYFAGFNLNETNTFGINGMSEFHVTIVHKPSNTVIFDKDVRVSS